MCHTHTFGRRYLVTLDSDMREDDAKLVRDAIAMIKGVRWVESVIADIDHQIAYRAALQETRERVYRALTEPAPPG